MDGLRAPANPLDPAVRRYWGGQLVVGAALLAAAAGLVASATGWHDTKAAAPVGVFVAAGLLAAAVLPTRCYRRHRWEVDGVGLYVQRGVLGTLTTVLPHTHVAEVEVQADPWQRSLGLATITVGSAGGALRIPGLSGFEANRLAAEIQERAGAGGTHVDRSPAAPAVPATPLLDVPDLAVVPLAAVYAGPPLTAALVLAVVGQVELAIAALGLGVVGASLAVETRRRLAYSVRLPRVAVRGGLLSRRLTVLDASTVIAVTVRRGLLQRRLGLATVLARRAGRRSFRIRHVHVADVAPLIEALVPELRASAEAARERSLPADPPTRTPARRRSSAAARSRRGPRTPEEP